MEYCQYKSAGNVCGGVISKVYQIPAGLEFPLKVSGTVPTIFQISVGKVPPSPSLIIEAATDCVHSWAWIELRAKERLFWIIPSASNSPILLLVILKFRAMSFHLFIVHVLSVPRSSPVKIKQQSLPPWGKRELKWWDYPAGVSLMCLSQGIRDFPSTCIPWGFQ